VATPRSPMSMLTPPQLRAARALVGWSREDLAEKSKMSAQAVREFELGSSDPKLGTVHKWRRALEAAGVRFIDADQQGGSGVRFMDAAAEKDASPKPKKGRGKR
jgi:transcriptional regulator with XRE-family HTH domain